PPGPPPRVPTRTSSRSCGAPSTRWTPDGRGDRRGPGRPRPAVPRAPAAAAAVADGAGALPAARCRGDRPWAGPPRAQGDRVRSGDRHALGRGLRDAERAVPVRRDRDPRRLRPVRRADGGSRPLLRAVRPGALGGPHFRYTVSNQPVVRAPSPLSTKFAPPGAHPAMDASTP